MSFFPTPRSSARPLIMGCPMRRSGSTAADGVKLHGWWVPKEGAPVFLWFHGNAGNISHRLENIKLLLDLVGVSVFSRLPGIRRIPGAYVPGRHLPGRAAAYRYLAETRRVPVKDIVLFGRSLGTALATDAVLVPCRSLILESAYTDSQDDGPALYAFHV